MIWIIWLLFIIISAIIDSRKYKEWLIDTSKEPTINHKKNINIRLIIAIIFYLIFAENLLDWKVILFYMIGTFFSFWLIFDILLNKLNNKPIDYEGTEAVSDKKIDKKIPFIVQFWFKFLFGFMGIYMYYNTDLL